MISITWRPFAPMSKLNMVKVLLSFATTLDWHLQQLDIKNAFLSGDLEKVYEDRPSGFEQGFGSKV